MDPLTSIPIPLHQRWREFRVTYFPPILFVVLIACIVWMWGRYVHPANVVGEVEAVRANVLSVVAGTVEQLRTDRFQKVTNGQELVVLAVMEPEVLDAELAAIAADLRLMKSRMDLDKTRNVDSYSRLRSSLATERINLELARIRLQQVESEFDRARQLLDQHIIASGSSIQRNDFGYDVALRDRDAVRKEIQERTALVAQLEKDLGQMGRTGVVEVSPSDAAVEDAIRSEQERMRQLQKRLVLKAPIDGFVSTVNHRPGEKVAAGEPILAISADTSDRIIGWVRQPVRARPAVGDVVEVRPNRPGKGLVRAIVTDVGGQMEPVSLTALPPNTPPNHVEVGLQFMAKAPAGVDLIPGEMLELTLKSRSSSRGMN